jgi:hypothetical protein
MPNTTTGDTLVKDLQQILVNNNYTGTIISGRNTPALTFIDVMGIQRNFKSEFILQVNNRDIRVQARYLSGTGGTVIEKLPYLLENAKKVYPQNEVIFILEGSGYDKGSSTMNPRLYMKNMVSNVGNGKKIVIWDKKEFEDWVIKGMPNL